MTSMTQHDTHRRDHRGRRDRHPQGAARRRLVDRDDGRLLDTKEFSTTRAGYRALLRWMTSYGQLHAVGIEGTGSYGAGITRI